MTIKERIMKWLNIEPVKQERIIYRERIPNDLPRIDVNIKSDPVKEALTFALPGWQNISGQVISNVDISEQKRLQLIDKCIECGFCEINCVSSGFTLSARQRIVVQREIERLKQTHEDDATLQVLIKEYDYARLS